METMLTPSPTSSSTPLYTLYMVTTRRLRRLGMPHKGGAASYTIDGILGLQTINKIDGIYIAADDSEVPLAFAVNDESMTRVKSGFLETLWSLDIPMVNVLAETKNFQLWGYFSGKHERVRIGKCLLTRLGPKGNRRKNLQMTISPLKDRAT